MEFDNKSDSFVADSGYQTLESRSSSINYMEYTPYRATSPQYPPMETDSVYVAADDNASQTTAPIADLTTSRDDQISVDDLSGIISERKSSSLHQSGSSPRKKSVAIEMTDSDHVTRTLSRPGSRSTGDDSSGLNQSRTTGGSRPTSGVTRPTSGTPRRRPSGLSYADSDGVVLRGDKDRARRKSNASQSSRASTRLSDTEWKKNFIIPYKPRPQATKIINKSLVEVPSRDKLPYLTDPTPTETVRRMGPKHYRHHHEHNYLTTTHNRMSTHTHHKPSNKRVEIHYEDCLPKELWLEMKPKRFTKNHKHGNHFEIKKVAGGLPITSPAAPSTSTGSDGKKVEAFIWENPHQIWLMEKTQVKSE